MPSRPVAKYGAPFPSDGESVADKYERIHKEGICYCGQKLQDSDKYCSQCGRPRHRPFTEDEKAVLAYLRTGAKIDMNAQSLLPPLCDAIKLRRVLETLARAGYLTYAHGIYELNKYKIINWWF